MGRLHIATGNEPGGMNPAAASLSPRLFRARRCFALGAGLVVLALALSSCGVKHISALREAENVFSDAAATDNQQRFDTNRASPEAGGVADEQRVASGKAIGEAGRAATGYRLAVKMIDKLMAEKKSALEEDDLLCSAYMIKAMSLWRLGEFGSAITTAKDGGTCRASSTPGSTTPRDTALLSAIAGLARIDEAYAMLMSQTTGFDEYRKIRTEIEQALGILTSAAAGAPADHPVRAYLLISRMAAIRVWQTAVGRKKLTGDARIAELKDANDKAVETLAAYKNYLECQLRNTNDASVTDWQNLFGIGAPGPATCP